MKLSMLMRLDDIARPCWEQKYQLRMAPGGFEPSNVVFYDGRIKTSPDLKLEDFPEAILFEEWTESLNSQGVTVPAEAGKSTITASPIGQVFPFMVDAQDTFCFREVGGTSKGNTQMANLVLNYIRSFLAFGKGIVLLNQIVVVPYLQQRELYLKTVAENEEFKGLSQLPTPTKATRTPMFSSIAQLLQILRARSVLLTIPTAWRLQPLATYVAWPSSGTRASIPPQLSLKPMRVVMIP
jgi:hypothetical protein